MLSIAQRPSNKRSPSYTARHYQFFQSVLFFFSFFEQFRVNVFHCWVLSVAHSLSFVEILSRVHGFTRSKRVSPTRIAAICIFIGMFVRCSQCSFQLVFSWQSNDSCFFPFYHLLLFPLIVPIRSSCCQNTNKTKNQFKSVRFIAVSWNQNQSIYEIHLFDATRALFIILASTAICVNNKTVSYIGFVCSF